MFQLILNNCKLIIWKMEVQQNLNFEANARIVNTWKDKQWLNIINLTWFE